jgi:hypothetical protein
MLIGALMAPKTCFAGCLSKGVEVVVDAGTVWLKAAAELVTRASRAQTTRAEAGHCLHLRDIMCKAQIPTAKLQTKENKLMHGFEALTPIIAARQACHH